MYSLPSLCDFAADISLKMCGAHARLATGDRLLPGRETLFCVLELGQKHTKHSPTGSKGTFLFLSSGYTIDKELN